MSNIETSKESAEGFGDRQIWFKVENETAFELKAQGSFSDAGEYTQSPSSIDPFSSGAGGHIKSSNIPFTGAAGMSGYTITNNNEKVYLRFLGSNPFASTQGNYSTSAIFDGDAKFDQGDYNWLYYREEKDDTKPFNGGTLTVISEIGREDECTAVFTVTFEQ